MGIRLVVGGTLLLSLCLLGGCTKYWYQEGRTLKQTKEDLAACQAEVPRHADAGSSLALDAYDGPAVRECMEQRGYRQVPESALPNNVLRESSPVFGVPGVAGTMD